MLRKQLSILALSLGVLCLSEPLTAASTLTSNDGLNVLTYVYGPSGTVYSDWTNNLISGVLGESAGFYSTTSFTAGGNFLVQGASIAAGNYQGNTGYPMILTMPNLATFTGLELQLKGTLAVTLDLSGGSTVATGLLDFGATPTIVTFVSPVQIIAAEIDTSSGGSFLYDVSWGTADPSKLPVQPQQGQSGGGDGDTSPVPEVSSLWLMGGGLLGLSQMIRKRRHFLNF